MVTARPSCIEENRLLTHDFIRSTLLTGCVISLILARLLMARPDPWLEA